MQVRKLWEVLLSAQPGWGEALRQATVEGLVRARLVGGVTSTKRVAEGKRIFETEAGFHMTRVRLTRRAPVHPSQAHCGCANCCTGIVMALCALHLYRARNVCVACMRNAILPCARTALQVSALCLALVPAMPGFSIRDRSRAPTAASSVLHGCSVLPFL